MTRALLNRSVVTLDLPEGGQARFVWGDNSAPEWVPVGASPVTVEHTYPRVGSFRMDVLATHADGRVFGSGWCMVTTQPDPVPTITSLTPDHGPEVGGSGVVIDGQNFTGATGASFDDVEATGFFVISDVSIVCTTPPGTGAVDVVVEHPAGNATLAGGFTYDTGRFDPGQTQEGTLGPG